MKNQLKKKNLVIVSGLAGSGKTIAVHALEDLGYYCIDNLPSVFLSSFLDEKISAKIEAEHIALALDSRDVHSPQALRQVYTKLEDHFHVSVLYLHSTVDVLLTRFRETRRHHPLIANHSVVSLRDAIHMDEHTLSPIKNLAHRTLDTSFLSMQNLKRFIYHNFAPNAESTKLFLSFVSFGFKHGTPNDLDTIFDVRCFKNPYYDPELRHLTGKSPQVKECVFSDPNVALFMQKVCNLIEFLYPLYNEEGKRYFAVGIGCTGGKHRSVAIAEELAAHFRTQYPLVSTDHRHIES